MRAFRPLVTQADAMGVQLSGDSLLKLIAVEMAYAHCRSLRVAPSASTQAFHHSCGQRICCAGPIFGPVCPREHDDRASERAGAEKTEAQMAGAETKKAPNSRGFHRDILGSGS